MPRFANSIASAALALVCIAVHGQGSDVAGRGRPIEFESDSFSLDRPTNTMTFRGFRIETGGWNLVADEATALATELDFSRGQWAFKGNVRIAIDTARISAQEASFTFENQMLMSAALFGDPVVFEDTAPEREGPVKGTSDSIEYDNVESTIRMLGHVTLTVGPYDTRGCDLIYYLNEEDFTTGSSDCDEPFTMVILPAEESEPEGGAEQQP